MTFAIAVIPSQSGNRIVARNDGKEREERLDVARLHMNVHVDDEHADLPALVPAE
jgi:hypothetical protein